MRFTDNRSNSRIHSTIEPELSAKRKKTNLVQANKVSIKISGVRNSPLNREKMYKYYINIYENSVIYRNTYDI